ncbi:MAG: hypothetical protein MUW56_04345 [Chryseobacterium sp.]|uniref:hypothetical protein n=1 Tax=Chryseobacterium sp. TaxID=1871047 RepID=UPI0025C5455C|nr:hypothetical protein [Chryseobacterium sp.]MCJ7932865.1 hypothetical protein [Chryseobacterium sp.]
MKIKLNHTLFTLLFVVCFTLSFGQKTEFTVPKNIETLQSSIFNFSNDFTKDEPKAAAAADDHFSTTVDLYQLRYEADYKNPYLNLALTKGARPKQFIQRAVWNVSMKKISAKSTKVTVVLGEVTPDRESRKDVDVKLTRSTGKVEEEIKDFLFKDKEAESSDAHAVSGAVSAADEAGAAAAQAQAEVAAFEARSSLKKITSEKLQRIFSKKQFIPLPATAETFTKPLQVQPSELECKGCRNGKYTSWDFDDFNMIYANMAAGEEYYALQYYGNDMVSGLPYGLVFNESSPTECKSKFARYDAQLYQTTVDTDENTSNALTVVTFKMNAGFVRLEFGNGYLSRLVISNKEF